MEVLGTYFNGREHMQMEMQMEISCWSLLSIPRLVLDEVDEVDLEITSIDLYWPYCHPMLNQAQAFVTLCLASLGRYRTVLAMLHQAQAFVILGLGLDVTHSFTSSTSRVQSTNRPSNPAPFPAAR